MREISYACISEAGDRKYNEDYVKVIHNRHTWTFAAADGLGGQGCGDLASHLAVDSILEDDSFMNSPDYFAKAFHLAQEKVLEAQESRPEAARMCTTLVLLCLKNSMAQWAHIGDSRLYRFHGWFLKNQTRDHSVPQMLVDLGEIRQQDIRHHPDRSRLLKVIGQPWEGEPYEISEVFPIEQNDSFLLCTDGFWEYITEREMRWCLIRSGTAQQWLDLMTERVKRHGKGHDMDNFSAVCVQIR